MGACAFFVAMFTRDTFIAFSEPVCIYFLAECIGGTGCGVFYEIGFDGYDLRNIFSACDMEL